MSAKTRLAMASMIALFVFIFSMAVTVPALADEAPPPVTEAPLVIDEGSDPTGGVTADGIEPASPADPLPDSAEPPESTLGTEETTSAELLAQVPEGTEVVILDQSGNTVPLAAREADQIMTTGDPMWCPAGVTPGGAGCTTNYGTFAALLADPVFGAAGPQKAGVIWVAFDYAGADLSTITINGSLLGNTFMKNYALTIQGGWNGLSGSAIVNPLTPSLFNDRLIITGWNANVTLKNITISGTGGDGLTVNTTRDIILMGVQSNSNSGKGADLTNVSGSGKITISSSQFNSNGGAHGLRVVSNGAITLSNVTASQNTPNGYGALLDNSSSPLKSDITLSGTNTFNGNHWDGLVVYSLGAILANDVTASGNGTASGGGGAAFYNAYSGVTAGVTLTGLNLFNDNYGSGLSVNSKGAIKISNLIANSNDGNGYGAYLDNSTASTAQPITLTGSSQFKYNKYTGLQVYSRGLISLNNVSANGSLNGSGLSIDQCMNLGSGCTGFASGGLKLSGINFFNDNYSYGLYVGAVGALTLNSVTANGNGLPAYGYGVLLDNTYAAAPKGVTLTGTNVFNNNRSGGLSISSLGAIKLNNINANDTVFGYGAAVDNSILGAVGGITVSGTNTLNGNAYGGLLVQSRGAISLTNAQATANGFGGGSGFGVSLSNSSAGSAQPVTVSGINDFSANKSIGLSIGSLGAIKLNSVTANYSVTSFGVQLYTAYNSASVYSVTLSGTNAFNNNTQYGLYINTNGMILLNNVSASENHLSGVYALNTGSGSLTPRNVVMTGTNFFNGNWNTGLDITSYGSISVANVTASGNGLVGSSGYGVYLDNSFGTIPRGIILSGINVFNGNYNTGLFVSSLGAIAASNLTANDNGVVNNNGAYLYNSISGAVGGVALSGANTFNGNYEEGLIVSTYGAITINNLSANGNGTNATHEGAQLSNSGAAPSLPKPVKLTGINQFNGNFGYGLVVYSLGLITTSNLTANENNTYSGVGLYNNFGSSTAGVTLSGVNSFNANKQSGLEVESYGAINLLTTSVSANGNGLSLSIGYGVILSNSSAATPQAVKLLGTNIFNGNYQGGLQIMSLGAITVNNVTAGGNANDWGANLNNAGTGTSGTVTLTGTNSFNANSSGGLLVNSRGAITASNLTANDNINGKGTLFDNCQWTGSMCVGSGNVTLTGTNIFSGNNSTGLEIASAGTITLNNVTANKNGLSSGFGYGAWMVNSSASTPQAVKMTGTNIFNGNKSGGLTVYSLGAITINNLSASYTLSGGGASLYNNGGGVGNVILTGINIFNKNNGSGLQIGSNGNVSLTKITADGNNGDGLYTNPLGTITLLCGSFTNNSAYGWHLLSLVGITMKGVVSAGNVSGDTWFGSFPVIIRICPLP